MRRQVEVSGIFLIAGRDHFAGTPAKPDPRPHTPSPVAPDGGAAPPPDELPAGPLPGEWRV